MQRKNLLDETTFFDSIWKALHLPSPDLFGPEGGKVKEVNSCLSSSLRNVVTQRHIRPRIPLSTDECFMRCRSTTKSGSLHGAPDSGPTNLHQHRVCCRTRFNDTLLGKEGIDDNSASTNSVAKYAITRGTDERLRSSAKVICKRCFSKH